MERDAEAPDPDLSGTPENEALGKNWDKQFHPAAWVVLAVIVFGLGAVFGRSTEVPLSADFWRIAAQPTAVVVAGAAALTAAAIAFRAQRAASLTALRGVRLQIKSGSVQYEKTYRADVQQRSDTARDTSVDRCWERFKWIVALSDDTGREDDLFDVVTAMLDGLDDDAQALDDQTLTTGIVQYNALVLKAYDDRLNS